MLNEVKKKEEGESSLHSADSNLQLLVMRRVVDKSTLGCQRMGFDSRIYTSPSQNKREESSSI